jgi:hypothetical protein
LTIHAEIFTSLCTHNPSQTHQNLYFKADLTRVSSQLSSTIRRISHLEIALLEQKINASEFTSYRKRATRVMKSRLT